MWSDEKAAHGRTIANYLRAALNSAEAGARDLARVRSEQTAISERIANDYQTRLAGARAAADRLRSASGEATTDSRGPGGSPVPARAAGPAAQDGFSLTDRLIATEQALQLQALIDWVEAQAKVDNSGVAASIGGQGEHQSRHEEFE